MQAPAYSYCKTTLFSNKLLVQILSCSFVLSFNINAHYWSIIGLIWRTVQQQLASGLLEGFSPAWWWRALQNNKSSQSLGLAGRPGPPPPGRGSPLYKWVPPKKPHFQIIFLCASIPPIYLVIN